MKTQIRLPSEKEQRILDQATVRPIRRDEQRRCNNLLDRHHYLGSLKAVGERMYYVATTANGGWLGILLFDAASKHLRYREKWIGWSEEQRRRRLGLVVNNARFLLLPGRDMPNLGSRVLRLVLDRLSADWDKSYGHPLLIVETFVDPEQFQGTVYKASGWEELGQTRGWRRCGQDYYVQHGKPKRLFVRELRRGARRSLAAERLAGAYAMVEEKVVPHCTRTVKEIRPLVQHFHDVPEYRDRIESYPVYSMLAIAACAHWCGAPRGQKDIAGFARRLSQAQRRAFGIRRDRRTGKYPAPSQPTFCRLFKAVDARKVEESLLAFQAQIRGPAPKQEVVAMDGKEPKHSQGQQLLTAVCVPSQYYLGSEPVSEKTNEIPVARELCKRLDLADRLVGLDALHTQVETARELVQEHGADYILTVKGNQKGIKRTLVRLFSATPAAFSPSGDTDECCPDGGGQPIPSREAPAALDACDARGSVLSSGNSSRTSASANDRTQAGDCLSVDQQGGRTALGSTVAQRESSVLGG